MLTKLGVAVVLVAAACGKGDKCEKAYDKVAPLLKGAGADDGKMDRAKMVEKCKQDIKDHPEREKMLDCIVNANELTMDQMMDCEKQARPDKTDKGDKGEKSAAEAIAKMGEFKDKVCACADQACVAKVTDEMTKWAQESAKQAPPKLSPDDTKKATEIGEAMSKCMQKAMGAGSSSGAEPAGSAK